MTIKRCILSALFLLCIASVAYFSPKLIYHFTSVPGVLTTPTSSTVTTRIPLSGTVTAKDSADFIPELPLVVKQVYVKTGDTVSAGDIVASVDKEQTLYAVASMLHTMQDLSKFSKQLADYLPKDKITSVDGLKSVIPSFLLAPASGTVLTSSLQENAILTPGISCMTIADCNKLLVSLTADEANIATIAVGQTVYLKSAAHETPFAADITAIAPAASQTFSGTKLKTVVEITASVRQTAGLKPGYTVYGYLFEQSPQQKLLVPLSAVYQQEEQEYVYLWKNGKAYRQNITTDGVYAQNAIVTSGLSDSDIVVMSRTEPKNAMPIRKEKTHA